MKSYENQLKYHAPHLQFKKEGTSRLNVGTNKKQVLSAEGLAIVSSWPEFQASRILYEAAKAVASERNAQSSACAAVSPRSRACSANATCNIRSTIAGQALLRKALPVSCQLPKVQVGRFPQMGVQQNTRKPSTREAQTEHALHLAPGSARHEKHKRQRRSSPNAH